MAYLFAAVLAFAALWVGSHFIQAFQKLRIKRGCTFKKWVDAAASYSALIGLIYAIVHLFRGS